MERPVRVTIKDVARVAGVSPGVVSATLGGNGQSAIRVSVATRERIRRVAAELGYRPNAIARALQRRRTQTVLLAVYFMESLTKVSFLAEVLDATLSRAVSLGYDLTIHMVRKEDGEKPGVLGDGRADGCIWVAPWVDDAAFPSVDAAGAPLVVLCARVDGATCVVADNRAGVTAVVEHLVGLGHRRVGFVEHHGSWMTHDCRERRAAFLQVCAERELQGQVIYLSDLEAILRGRPDARPTALVGWNDELAMLSMECAQGLGLSIPEELSVVGFDSTTWCEELRPRLTSVHQPIRVMAENAVDLLIGSIEGTGSQDGGNGTAGPANVHVFPCRLDVRDSTAPAPQAG